MRPDKKPPPQRKAPRTKGTLPPFDQFIREAAKLRDKAMELLRQDGHHAPVLILYTDGGMEVGGIHATGDRPMHEHVRAIVQSRKAKAFVAISESWMVGAPHAEASLREHIPPSKHPERREALTVSAVHPAGRQMWVMPFSREHGTITFGKMLDSAALGMTLGGGIPQALGGEESFA
jgi:hypothetical protein